MSIHLPFTAYHRGRHCIFREKLLIKDNVVSAVYFIRKLMRENYAHYKIINQFVQ